METLTRDLEAESTKVTDFTEQVAKLRQELADKEAERVELEDINSKLTFDNDELNRLVPSLKENISILKTKLESAGTPGFASPKAPKLAKKLSSYLRPSPIGKL